MNKYSAWEWNGQIKRDRVVNCGIAFTESRREGTVTGRGRLLKEALIMLIQTKIHKLQVSTLEDAIYLIHKCKILITSLCTIHNNVPQH